MEFLKQTFGDEATVNSFITGSLIQPGQNAIKAFVTQKAILESMSQLDDSKLTNYNEKQQLNITETLTATEFLTLEQCFPELRLTCSKQNCNSHGYFAASRKCETKILLQRCRYHSNIRVIDIGGNWLHHYQNKVPNIHSCCPILDDYDSTRWALRCNRYKQIFTTLKKTSTIDNEINNAILNYKNHEVANNLFCNTTFQTCNFKAETGIAVHSLYDIHIVDLINGMEEKGMETLYAVMLFDSAIINNDTGKFSDDKIHYRIDDEFITFSFTQDSGFNYKHKLTTYMSYFTVNTVLSRTGKVFTIELQENRNGAQFLRIVNTGMEHMGRNLIHKLWLTAKETELVIVKSFILNPLKAYKTLNSNERDLLETFTLTIPKYYWNKALEYALGVHEEKFKPQELYSYVRSTMGKWLFACKDFIVKGNVADGEKAFLLANTVYIHAYQQKYNMGKIVQAVTNDIRYVRSMTTNSLWDKLTAVKPSSYFDRSAPCALLRPLHKFLFDLNTTDIIKHLQNLKIDQMEYREYSGNNNCCINALNKLYFEYLSNPSNQNKKKLKNFTVDYTEEIDPRTKYMVDTIMNIVDQDKPEDENWTTDCKTIKCVNFRLYKTPMYYSTAKEALRYYKSTTPYSGVKADIDDRQQQRLENTTGDYTIGDLKIWSKLHIPKTNLCYHINDECHTIQVVKNAEATIIIRKMTNDNFCLYEPDTDQEEPNAYGLLINFNDDVEISCNKVRPSPKNGLCFLECFATMNYSAAKLLNIIRNAVGSGFKACDDADSFSVQLETGYAENELVYTTAKLFDINIIISYENSPKRIVTVTLPGCKRSITLKLKNEHYDRLGMQCTEEELDATYANRELLYQEQIPTSSIQSTTTIEVDEVATEAYAMYEVIESAWKPGTSIHCESIYEASSHTTSIQVVNPSTAETHCPSFIIPPPVEFSDAEDSVTAASSINSESTSSYFTVSSIGTINCATDNFLDDVVYYNAPSYRQTMQIVRVEEITSTPPETTDTTKVSVLPATQATREQLPATSSLPSKSTGAIPKKFKESVNKSKTKKTKANEESVQIQPILNEDTLTLPDNFMSTKNTLAPNEEPTTTTGLTIVNTKLEEAPLVLHFIHNNMFKGYAGFAQTVAKDCRNYTDTVNTKKRNNKYDLPSIIITKGKRFKVVLNAIASRYTFVDKCAEVVETLNNNFAGYTIHTVAIGMGLWAHKPETVIGLLSSTIKTFKMVMHVHDNNLFIKTQLPSQQDTSGSSKDFSAILTSYSTDTYTTVNVDNMQDVYALANFVIKNQRTINSKQHPLKLKFSDKSLVVTALKILNIGSFCRFRATKEDWSNSEIILWSSLGIVETTNIVWFDAVDKLLSILRSVAETTEVHYVPDALLVTDLVTEPTERIYVVNSAPYLQPYYVVSTSTDTHENFTVDDTSLVLLTRCDANAVNKFLTALDNSEKGRVVTMEVQDPFTIKCIKRYKFTQVNSVIVVVPPMLDENTTFLSEDAKQLGLENFGFISEASSDVAAMRNSIQEIYCSWVMSLDTIKTNLAANHIMSINPYISSTITDDTYGCIDTHHRKWVVKPVTLYNSYQMAFDGTNVVDISFGDSPTVDLNKLEYSGTARYISISSETRIVNAPALAAAADKILKENELKNIGKFRIVAGGPGCGKSHYILQNHDPGTKDKLGDIVLTATREAAEDLRARAIAMGIVDEKQAERKYRTTDSYLMNGKDTCETTWMDEGMMEHSGKPILAGLKSKAKNIVILGDFAQIPFINRQKQTVMLCSSYERFNWPVSYLKETKRCPIDVTNILNGLNLYPFKLTTTSKVVNSIRIVQINNAATIPKTTKVLTYTQDEKLKLSKLGLDVSTVHEFQGKQAARIALVRLNSKNIPPYRSIHHILVAISRHTESLDYYTIEPNDKTATTLRGGALSLSGGGGKLAKNYIQGTKGEVVLCGPYGYDNVTQPKLARRIVFANQENRGSPAVLMLDAAQPYDDYMAEPHRSSTPMDVSFLQEYHDNFYGDPELSNRDYDDVMLEQCEINITGGNFSLDLTTNFFSKFETAKVEPQLRTVIQKPIKTTPRTVLTSFNDRNGDVPELKESVNHEVCVNKCLDRFCSTYIRDKQIFDKLEENQIFICPTDIDTWLRDHPPTVTKIIEQSELDLELTKLYQYTYILKRNPKVVLEPTAGYTIKSPQTIAFLEKIQNAVFAPIAMHLKERVLGLLKPNFIINSDLDIKTLENILTKRLNNKLTTTLTNILEIDFSKYDKSQNYLIFMIETALMRKFGVPQEYLAMWVQMHRVVCLMERSTQFKTWVTYQRRSGDPLTYLLNTLILMTVLAYVYDLNDTFALFGGDDSIVFTKSHLGKLEDMDVFASIFNLESKLLSYDYPYFCSKFLIRDEFDQWHLVPDPLKLLVKLGRRDLVDKQHAEEYRVSTLDLLDSYDIDFVLQQLEQAVYNRYKVNPGVTAVCNTIKALMHNAEEFHKLYDYSRTPVHHGPRPDLDI